MYELPKGAKVTLVDTLAASLPRLAHFNPQQASMPLFSSEKIPLSIIKNLARQQACLELYQTQSHDVTRIGTIVPLGYE